MSVRLIYELQNGMLRIAAYGNWTLPKITRADQKMLAQKQQEIIQAIRRENLKAVLLFYAETEESTAAAVQSVAAVGNSVVQDTQKDREYAWGSLLLSFFCVVCDEADKKNVPVDVSALLPQMRKLLEVNYNDPLSSIEPSRNPFYLLGDFFCAKFGQVHASMNFAGEITASLLKFFAGKASVSAKDVWQEMYNAGAASLPIISLVSILLGLILAFVSAIQLQVIGAEVYVSSLVTVSMVRVMSPVLTGIVIAGRIGASYAATIGSMQVNEEVDALETFGINPVEFLVLPRFLALSLMMPFLTVYADFMGILGGFAVIFWGWDISFYAFLENVQAFTTMQHIFIGLFHSFIFGILIAMSGCYQGIVSGRDAEAVGRATTLAVVHSIIGIIVSTSILTIILSGFNL